MKKKRFHQVMGVSVMKKCDWYDLAKADIVSCKVYIYNKVSVPEYHDIEHLLPPGVNNIRVLLAVHEPESSLSPS